MNFKSDCFSRTHFEAKIEPLVDQDPRLKIIVSAYLFLKLQNTFLVANSLKFELTTSAAPLPKPQKKSIATT